MPGAGRRVRDGDQSRYFYFSPSAKAQAWAAPLWSPLPGTRLELGNPLAFLRVLWLNPEGHGGEAGPQVSTCPGAVPVLRRGAWPWWLRHSPVQEREASNLSGSSGPKPHSFPNGPQKSVMWSLWPPPIPGYGEGRMAHQVIIPVGMGIGGLRGRGKSRCC